MSDRLESAEPVQLAIILVEQLIVATVDILGLCAYRKF